jgi:hypothetical protein
MPVFHPTEEEFKNPIIYIEHLMKGDARINQYGCIKIVPPKSFRPPLAFDMKSE